MKTLHLFQKIKNYILHKRQVVMYTCNVCDSVFDKTYNDEIDLYFDICPQCKAEFIRKLKEDN